MIPTFPILDWYQPLEAFPTLKALGINGIVGCPVDMAHPDTIAPTINAWLFAAKSMGFTVWIQSDAPGPWLDDPTCAGVFLIPDEPNAGGPATPLRTPEQMNAITASIRKVTTKPILLDLDGAALIFQHDDNVLKGYLDACDIVCADYYAINRANDRGDIYTNGRTIDRIRHLAPGKKIFGVPECNDQGLRYSGYFPAGRGPTGSELNAILRDLIDHKADGIVYFHDVFAAIPQDDGSTKYGWKSFGYDTITPDCQQVMKSFAASVNVPVIAPPIVVKPPTPAPPATAKPTDIHSVIIDGVQYVPAK